MMTFYLCIVISFMLLYKFKDDLACGLKST